MSLDSEYQSVPPTELQADAFSLDVDDLPQDSDAEFTENATNWSTDDLEQAYLKALEASEGLEPDVAEVENLPIEEEFTSAFAGLTNSTIETALTQDSADVPTKQTTEPERLQAPQIIEAILFVGGEGLTSRKISTILKEGLSPETIEDEINKLNSKFQEEARPYEIALHEGGYRLQLTPEYDKFRLRLYGYTPREVRLPQDALEMLAYIAYQQPVSKTNIEELGRSAAHSRIRLLLRHQLISMHRDDKQIMYQTTNRFLQLFGLRNLKDLPRAEDLARK